MKYAICSIHDEKYAELANITFYQNKKEYCSLHKYDLLHEEGNFVIAHSGFEKIRFVLETLKTKKYEWVFWLGCDTLITNFKIKIEDRVDDKYHFIICSDSNFLVNSDSFLIKSSEEGISFFQAVLDSYEEFIKDGYAEQAAIISLLKQEKFSKLTKIIPQRNLNAYNYCMYPHLPSMNSRRDFFGNDGNLKKGDFILHWPGMSMENRMLSAKHYSKQIVK